MCKERRLIAIIGVDGSGKSSVISKLQVELARFKIGVRVLASHRSHHNKSGGRSDIIANHALPPRSNLFSMVKIIYRAIQWGATYYFHHAPFMYQGNLILCDRFYFDDLLIDPWKHRYAGPAWPVQALRNLLPRPHAYVLLDVPEDILYSRKQEVPYDEVKRLRQAHLSWIQNQPWGYEVDASAPLHTVVENTYQFIQHYLQATESACQCR